MAVYKVKSLKDAEQLVRVLHVEPYPVVSNEQRDVVFIALAITSILAAFCRSLLNELVHADGRIVRFGMADSRKREQIVDQPAHSIGVSLRGGSRRPLCWSSTSASRLPTARRRRNASTDDQDGGLVARPIVSRKFARFRAHTR